MSVSGMGSGRELHLRVGAFERNVEPREEGMDVCRAGQRSMSGLNREEEGITTHSRPG